MEPARKRAYEGLIFCALVDIRNMCSDWPLTRWWNPFQWRNNWRIMKRSNLIADMFHNVAEFMPMNMDGFDEDRFWRLMKSYEKYDSYMKIFRERFDLELSRAQKGNANPALRPPN